MALPIPLRIGLALCIFLSGATLLGRFELARQVVASRTISEHPLPRHLASIQESMLRLRLDLGSYASLPDDALRRRIFQRMLLLDDETARALSAVSLWLLPGGPTTAAFDNLSDVLQTYSLDMRAVPLARLPETATALAGALRTLDADLHTAVQAAFASRAAALAANSRRMLRLHDVLTAALVILVISWIVLALLLVRMNSRSQAMARLSRNTEVRMSLALEAASAGWWHLDQNDIITASAETFELCGLRWSPTLTMADWATNVIAEDRQGLLEVLAESRRTQSGITRHRFRIRHPSRGTRWLDLVSRPILDQSGKQVGAHGLVQDDSDRVELEESLREAKDLADQAVAAKSRMLAAASHDLRQPLQSMFLFLSALEGEDDGTRRAEITHQLGLGMNVLKTLLDSLVEVARLESGATEPRLRGLPLDVLLGEIGNSYLPRAREKGIEILVDATPVTVRSDPDLLGRMVRNLVENAIRYTRKGTITLRCRVEDGCALIEVADTGIGIPKIHQALIWEEFHQVGNHERDRGQGLGLGLAIVRSLGRALDHEISMESTVGIGSTFRIRVPLGHIHATEAPGPKEVSPARTPRIPVQPVLVIDDDPLVLGGLEAMLRGRGYRVVAVPSGDAAAVAAAEQPPCFVVADYRLRNGETGIEAIAKVRAAARSTVPAMVLTGEVDAAVAREAAAHGIAFQEKPVPHRALMGLIERATAAPPHW